MQKKYDRPTRHTATLRRLYINPHRRLPQAFAHKPNKEKRKRKESQLPLCASTHSTVASRLSCLAPLVPRASRASQARALLSNVRFSATCASQHVRCLPSSLSLSSSRTELSRALPTMCTFHYVHLPHRTLSLSHALLNTSSYRTLSLSSPHTELPLTNERTCARIPLITVIFMTRQNKTNVCHHKIIAHCTQFSNTYGMCAVFIK